MKLGDNGEAFFVQETEKCNVSILEEPAKKLR
jgi:phosphatidate phosphatase PAH1